MVLSYTSQYGKRSALPLRTLKVSSNCSPIMYEPFGESRNTRTRRASERDQKNATMSRSTNTYANVYARRTPVIPAKNASTAMVASSGTRAVISRTSCYASRRPAIGTISASRTSSTTDAAVSPRSSALGRSMTRCVRTCGAIVLMSSGRT